MQLFPRYHSGNGSLTDWQAYSLLLLSDKSAVARATKEMRVELQYQPCHLLRGQEKEKYNHSPYQTPQLPRTHTHTYTLRHTVAVSI